MASSELKLSLIYKRLGLKVEKLKNLGYDVVMALQEEEDDIIEVDEIEADATIEEEPAKSIEQRA
jgi:hypothetical protein